MESPDARGKMTTWIVVTALVSAVVAGAAVRVYQQRTVSRLEAEADNRDRDVEQLRNQLAAVQSRLGAASADESAAAEQIAPTAPEEPASTSVPAPSLPAPGTAAKPKVETQFTFIKKATRSGSAATIVADYAQLLTGEAAAVAATAHGDESPPPNDYYIVNDNPKLRTLQVRSDATVKLTTKSDGTTVGPDGYSVSLAKFVELYNGTTAIRGAPYHITLTDGSVSAIAEQYTP